MSDPAALLLIVFLWAWWIFHPLRGIADQLRELVDAVNRLEKAIREKNE
jgi:hypothetical protein